MIITVNSCHYLATLGGRLSSQKKDIKWIKLPPCFVDKNSSWSDIDCHVMHTMKHSLSLPSAASYLSSYKLASIQFHTREEVSQPLKNTCIYSF